jgi:hypothetical protein
MPWSARKTLIFIAIACVVLWSLVAFVATAVFDGWSALW